MNIFSDINDFEIEHFTRNNPTCVYELICNEEIKIIRQYKWRIMFLKIFVNDHKTLTNNIYNVTFNLWSRSFPEYSNC